jgi:hypothetical protein
MANALQLIGGSVPMGLESPTKERKVIRIIDIVRKENSMADKVQKIREEVVRLKSNLIHGACASQIAMETRCKEEAYNEVLAILDTMQEESVSEDMENAAYYNCIDRLSKESIEDFKAGANYVISCIEREAFLQSVFSKPIKADYAGTCYNSSYAGSFSKLLFT